MMMNRQAKVSVMALWLSSLMPLTMYAVDVNFTANLIQNPPCDVVGPDGVDQPIRVPFGEVGITKINGENYRQDFTLTLSCGTGLGNAVALYLEYRGMVAESFDNKALQASQTGLGVRLYHQGVVIPPNTGTPITMSDNGVATLPLYAVPVKDTDPSAMLYEGNFTATASVEMNYP
ncbi:MULTISPECIES: fimbrial protein [Providencia]|uniref:fimbrial protein n=1 Tax=Providencia TaxID=586 RepID=UPI000A9D1042|nr:MULTISPECIES: fimbrial protein [Providencia]SST03447.1 putative fimbrial subunit SteE [Acinetobacter baumannii]MCX3069309.1 fimbrial protein [Providencia stuartii]MDT2014628.1 fimbrial protein [Providencia stuartii]MDT2081471.1 fimbrial protein [Providencia stuartii]MDX7492418.1 fimbrial protein [Providencia stuartii]